MFKFEIIVNVLVISIRFIWIPRLWVYSLYKLLIISAGIDVRCQNLTSKVGPHIEIVKIWRGVCKCDKGGLFIKALSYLI